MEARLVLEDGKYFDGIACGATEKVEGKMVAHTGMIGYQQAVSDPGQSGNIVCLTYPLQGNYGVNSLYEDSLSFRAKGVIMREICEHPSNWKAEDSFPNYLQKQGITGLTGVDTRAVARYLQRWGELKGSIVHAKDDPELVAKNLKASEPVFSKLVERITVPSAYVHSSCSAPEVVVIDLGVKLSFLRALEEQGKKFMIVSADFNPQEIIDLNPACVLMAGGPGNPNDAGEGMLERIRSLIPKVPLVGISLGKYVLVRVLGGEVATSFWGHRGDNIPVKDLKTGRIYATSQNHNWQVERASLPEQIQMTHYNMHDNSVEGFEHNVWPVWGISFWPHYLANEKEFSPRLPENLI